MKYFFLALLFIFCITSLYAMDDEANNISNNYKQIRCSLVNPPADKRETCLKEEKELFIQFYFQYIEQYSQQAKDEYSGINDATEDDIKRSAGKEFFNMMVKFRNKQLLFASAKNEIGQLLGGCFFYAYNTQVIIQSLFIQNIYDLTLFEKVYYGMMAVIQKAYPYTTSIVIFRRTVPELSIPQLQSYGFKQISLQFYKYYSLDGHSTWSIDAYEHHLSTYERWCIIS
ncbi:hypothetical protein JST56_06955 [Candidatus Dependentiae bacterium]|jgi:hypothetical protein|nr:hypothetical protein [Candidatus Dependentiae bacterium]